MDKKTLRNYILRSTFQELRPFLVRVLWLLLDMPIKVIVGLSPVMIGLVIFAVVAYLFVLSYFLFFVLPMFLCTNYLEINEMFKILIGLSIPLVILILIRSYFGKILSKIDKLFDLSSRIKNAYEKYKSWRDIIWNIELADRIVPDFPIGGKDDEKIGEFVKIRSKYSRKALANMLPIISELQKMNVGAKSIHESYLSDRFTDEEINEILENDFPDSQVASAIKFWRDEDQKDKMSFMRYLFMFTVLEDGIRKDEWYKLTELLAKLRISRYYIDLLKRDYSSLRTEFEEWEQKKSESTEENKATSALKAYYATLGLEESASDEEVKKAYHALALQYHPDLIKNADRIQECEAMMAKINEAYEKIKG